MKAFAWLLTVAMGILCFSCWGVAQWAMRPIIEDGLVPPHFTDFFLRSHSWLLFIPTPWVVYSAVLSSRREVSARAAFIFAGTFGFAMTSVVCIVVVGALMPYVPFRIR